MPIPMEPSSRFLGELAAGKLLRYGAILKDANTGQIVGHLKEAGDMGSLLSGMFTSPLKLAGATLNPVSTMSEVINMGVGIYNTQQIKGVQRSVDEVKSLVEGLQFATNVAAFSSVAGLGVSIAGFAAVNGKLKKIDEKIDRVATEIGVIRATLSELSISWEAMSEAQFLTAAETLITAEKAATSARRNDLAKEAASKFALLKNYYSQLLKQKGFYDNVELDVECIYEIVSRYTVACIGLLQAEFMVGDLGSYATRLESILSEYSDRTTFSPKEVYLARCDKLGPLNLEMDHRLLSDSLSNIAQATNENVARLHSYQAELEYISANKLSVPQYLADLRNHESDVVLIRHEEPSTWRSFSRLLS